MDMSRPFLKVKKFREDAIIPSKREEDAGYDMYGVFDEDFLVMNPGEIKLVPSGIGVEVPVDWVFFLAERGSTGSKAISRRAGIVDSGFRGEIKVILNNTSNKRVIFAKSEGAAVATFLEENGWKSEDVTIYPQSKAICQGILFYCPHVEIEVVDELSDNSDRGDGLLGSSNK